MSTHVRARVDVPHDVALLIFDLALVNDDVQTAKALRLVSRECAIRFAKPVWIVGAQNHYFNYLRSLGERDRRNTLRWLFTDGQGSARLAARVAAEATSAAAGDDPRELFRQLSKCTKFRI
jgi:hypothetical protein